MDTGEFLAPDAGAPIGERRGRVLQLLRDARGPLTAADVADRCGLHPNTARFHLDALVEAGLATRGPAPDAARGPGHAHPVPGRPPIGYLALPDGAANVLAGERRYRLLAEMLVSLVTDLADNPAVRAERAGREWGSYLTEEPPPYRRPAAAEALTELTALMAGIGFEPQVKTARGKGGRGAADAQVLLRQCPFREVAVKHQAVVCSLHLGVISGALDRMRAPMTADRLEPFAAPGVCRLRLRGNNAHDGMYGKDEPSEQVR